MTLVFWTLPRLQNSTEISLSGGEALYTLDHVQNLADTSRRRFMNDEQGARMLENGHQL